MKCHRQLMIILKDIRTGLIRGEDFYIFLRTSINETYKHLATNPNNNYDHLIELVVNNFPHILLTTDDTFTFGQVLMMCKNYINNVENNISFRIMLNIFYVNVYA